LYVETCEIGPGTSCFLTQLENDVADVFVAGTGHKYCDEIFMCSWFQLGHYKFYPGSVVVLGVSDGVVDLGRVRLIASAMAQVFMIVEMLEVVCFDRNLYSYIVVQPQAAVLRCIRNSDLYDHHPLGLHYVTVNNKDLTVVCPRFKIV
jgi:hypothetical protein